MLPHWKISQVPDEAESEGGMVEETALGITPAEEKIYVSVRLRPLNEKEIARNDVSDWECINGDTIIYRNTLYVSEPSVYPNTYTFDRVFGYGSSTRQVYEDGAKEVVLSVVSGINANVFAYGQTSSGKTYTMSGVTEYAIADIYNYIEQHKEREFILKFSAMEIYNECVRDLLSDDFTPLRLLDDPEKGTLIEKLTEEPLKDWNHFQELLSVCEAQRQIGETALNETSSRSHKILRLIIESSPPELSGKNNSSMLAATVNFVDLAGSEWASQSLSAGTSKGRTGHIPFTDSKLTPILQSLLGGNARTSIICTMSPARSHVEQSRNTLLFASCAKEVTNAQVNVVMSDKGLLKHLQRELSRLENELRIPGLSTIISDSAALLREKDLHMEELKNEIAKLTQQRDQLQSEVEELRRLMEDGGYSTVQDYSTYPKLRVRCSRDYENMSDKPTVDPQCINIGIRSFDASEYSDGHSVTDSEEQAVRIPDFGINSSGSDVFSQLSIPVPGVGRTSILSQDESGECRDDDSEEFCKVVRCIEMDDEGSNMHLVCNNSRACIQNTRSNQPSYLIEKEDDSMGLEDLDNGDEVQSESHGSSYFKEINQLESVPYAFASSPPEQSIEILQEKELPSSESFKKFMRSRSCKASLMGSLSLSFNEKVEVNGRLAPIEYEENTGTPQRYSRKISSLNDAAPNVLDDAAHNNLERSISYLNNQCPNQENSKIEISGDEENHCNSSSVPETQNPINAHQEAQPVDTEVQVPKENNIIASSVKNVGLDPVQEDPESPEQWHLQFRRIQKEIIELWDACNVSLVHRTYFFLLFKGDPADSIYLEVELRRLSFLKDTFDRDSQSVQGGRTLSAPSSLRDLRQERQMLCKQLQKKLTTVDREKLFLGWGIGLDSRNRSLQLAHLLWTRTEDLDHISDSASIVAMLVDFVLPEKPPKEMFTLNFAPQTSGRRWSAFRKRVLSLL